MRIKRPKKPEKVMVCFKAVYASLTDFFFFIARLLSAISAVQSKLRELEDENGVSRRRVRELEHELELCKIEVTKERSILMQREEFLAAQQRELELEEARRRKGKGKAKARDISFSREDTSRYLEVVEEKKGKIRMIGHP